MLQRMVEPLQRVGYSGKNPYEGKAPPMLELVTDMQTVWELDRLGAQQGIGGVPSITGNWRFTAFEAASAYWKYGFSGSIGQFTTRADITGLRFNFVGIVNGKYRYQVVLPYKNVPSSGAGGAAGLKSLSNPDYDTAQYRVSFIWNPQIMVAQTADSVPINSQMEFMPRDFAGKWMWKMHDLGADVNGCVIENILGNKGLFVSTHQIAVKPDHTEFGVAIFHKAEPSCVIEINTCNADPGYPVQTYNSANVDCPDDHSGTSPVPINTTLTFTPQKNSVAGDYEIAADSVLCESGPINHGQISGQTTLAGLVTQLNVILEIAGTWTVLNATQIQLVGPCSSLSLPFQV
jgi:hypothetical protein